MPALNDLLAPFGIAFGDAILEGQVPLEPDKPYYASGANIVRFPAGGHLHGWQLADKATEGDFSKNMYHSDVGAYAVPVLVVVLLQPGLWALLWSLHRNMLQSRLRLDKLCHSAHCLEKELNNGKLNGDCRRCEPVCGQPGRSRSHACSPGSCHSSGQSQPGDLLVQPSVCWHLDNY